MTSHNAVEVLFDDWEETIIWSCLQRVMGNVYVDDEKHPKSALAKLGRFASFGFLAGQPNVNCWRFAETKISS